MKPARKPRPPETGTLIGVRLQSQLLSDLDEWIGRQAHTVTRPRAIRSLLGCSLELISFLAKEARERPLKEAKVLILEPQPLTWLGIRVVVERLGHRVIGVTGSKEEAARLAAENRPELIISEAVLDDGFDAIELVNELLAQHPATAIFVTGFPERILTGNTPNPHYLITKPLKLDHLSDVLSKAITHPGVSMPPSRIVELGLKAR